MLTKEKIIDTINDLKNPVPMDEVIDKIIFLHKIEEGILQSDNNDVISDSDLDDVINTWSK